MGIAAVAIPALIAAGAQIGSAFIGRGGRDDDDQPNLLALIAQLSQQEAQRRQQRPVIATPPFNPDEPVGGRVPDLGELGRLIPSGPGGLFGRFGGLNLLDLLRGGGSFSGSRQGRAFGGF